MAMSGPNIVMRPVVAPRATTTELNAGMIRVALLSKPRGLIVLSVVIRNVSPHWLTSFADAQGIGPSQ